MDPTSPGPLYAATQLAAGDLVSYYDGAIAIAFRAVELMESLTLDELEEYLSAIAAQAAVHRDALPKSD